MTSVTIQLSERARRLIGGSPTQRILEAIRAGLDQENEYTVGAAVERRMSFSRSGPPTMEGLRVQSGLLRRSLRRNDAVISGNSVLGSIGSNVRYFGVHEFGFHGRQRVRAHTRRIAQAFGKKIKAREIEVKAHERSVNMPARRMVRRTIEERMDDYKDTLSERVVAAVAGEG